MHFVDVVISAVKINEVGGKNETSAKIYPIDERVSVYYTIYYIIFT